MEGIDSKLFRSWFGLGLFSLLLGFLFAFAAILIQALTGGVMEWARAPLFLGVLATVVFFAAMACVRSQMDEESKG